MNEFERLKAQKDEILRRQAMIAHNGKNYDTWAELVAALEKERDAALLQVEEAKTLDRIRAATIDNWMKAEADARLQVDELRKALRAAIGMIEGRPNPYSDVSTWKKLLEPVEKPTCDVVIGKLPRTDRCGLDLPCPDHATEKPVREHKLNCSTYRLADLTKCDCGVKRNDVCDAEFTTAYNERLRCGRARGHDLGHMGVIGGCRYEWA